MMRHERCRLDCLRVGVRVYRTTTTTVYASRTMCMWSGPLESSRVGRACGKIKDAPRILYYCKSGEAMRSARGGKLCEPDDDDDDGVVNHQTRASGSGGGEGRERNITSRYPYTVEA